MLFWHSVCVLKTGKKYQKGENPSFTRRPNSRTKNPSTKHWVEDITVWSYAEKVIAMPTTPISNPFILLFIIPAKLVTRKAQEKWISAVRFPLAMGCYLRFLQCHSVAKSRKGKFQKSTSCKYYNIARSNFYAFYF